MKACTLRLAAFLATIGLVAQSAVASPSSLNDPLLDRLVGHAAHSSEIELRKSWMI